MHINAFLLLLRCRGALPYDCRVIRIYQHKSPELGYIKFPMDTSSGDFNLIKDCISGKEEAWHAFVDRFSRLVYHSINKAVHKYTCNLSQEDIEDIYSSTFHSFIEKDCRKLQQFEGRQNCTLSSWVRLITVRHTIDFLRKQKYSISIESESDTFPSVSETLQDNNPSAQDYMETSENEKILEHAVRALPPSDRYFIELYYRKELPPEKVAQIMNLTVSTIYAKKSRIREKLEKIIK